MIAKCGSISSQYAAVANQTDTENPKKYTVSTKTLHRALIVLNTAAGAYACWYNPTAALTGALAGVAIRYIVGDNPQSHPLSEDERRGFLIASMCLTTCASAYTGAIDISKAGTFAAGLSHAASGVIGLEATANGVYPTLRKAVDG